jgi:hypothetical protein
LAGYLHLKNKEFRGKRVFKGVLRSTVQFHDDEIAIEVLQDEAFGFCLPAAFDLELGGAPVYRVR